LQCAVLHLLDGKRQSSFAKVVIPPLSPIRTLTLHERPSTRFSKFLGAGAPRDHGILASPRALSCSKLLASGAPKSLVVGAIGEALEPAHRHRVHDRMPSRVAASSTWSYPRRFGQPRFAMPSPLLVDEFLDDLRFAGRSCFDRPGGVGGPAAVSDLRQIAYVPARPSTTFGGTAALRGR